MQSLPWCSISILTFLAAGTAAEPPSPSQNPSQRLVEKQLTSAPHGHVLTNIGVWSADGEWIVYDVRSDPAGELFDGTRVERVNVQTGQVEILFKSSQGAHCGVVTASPTDDRIAFIHGPENPEDNWQYAAYHRRGVIVSLNRPGQATTLDARDLVAPFTPGALRGGTHVHTFSGDGQWIAFTYEDNVLEELRTSGENHAGDLNQRNVGVSVPRGPVVPLHAHPRNHRGSHFSVLVTRTTNEPRPGSDEISRAFSDAWVGTHGYSRPDGTRQSRAIAFQGHVVTDRGAMIAEVFIADLPEDVTQPAETGPLQGSPLRRPQPPLGTSQRRLTFTTNRAFPGIQGVRHWLRSSPDGSAIAFLMKSDDGVSQLWLISPNGGEPRQLTSNGNPISSAFSWSPDGQTIVHTMDQSVCVTDVSTGHTTRLTPPRSEAPLRPEACVFSPDGTQVAYVREIPSGDQRWNQIFVLDVQRALRSK